MTSKIVRHRSGTAFYAHLMRGDHHVATLLQRADDRWNLCDPREQRITKRSFQNTRDARDHFDQTYP